MWVKIDKYSVTFPKNIKHEIYLSFFQKKSRCYRYKIRNIRRNGHGFQILSFYFKATWLISFFIVLVLDDDDDENEEEEVADDDADK